VENVALLVMQGIRNGVASEIRSRLFRAEPEEGAKHAIRNNFQSLIFITAAPRKGS
jgi:hypothetical protein